MTPAERATQYRLAIERINEILSLPHWQPTAGLCANVRVAQQAMKIDFRRATGLRWRTDPYLVCFADPYSKKGARETVDGAPVFRYRLGALERAGGVA